MHVHRGADWPAFIYSDGRNVLRDVVRQLGHARSTSRAPSTFVVIYTGLIPPANPTNTTLSTHLHAQPGQLLRAPLYLPEYGGSPLRIRRDDAPRSTRGPGVGVVLHGRQRRHGRLDLAATGSWPTSPPTGTSGSSSATSPGTSPGRPTATGWRMSYMLYGSADPIYWYAVRVHQIRARGRAIWAAAGRDPSHVKSLDQRPDHLPVAGGLPAASSTSCPSHAALPDAVAIAPTYFYYSTPRSARRTRRGRST